MQLGVVETNWNQIGNCVSQSRLTGFSNPARWWAGYVLSQYDIRLLVRISKFLSHNQIRTFGFFHLETSRTMLKKRSKNRHPCLVPDLEEICPVFAV